MLVILGNGDLAAAAERRCRDVYPGKVQRLVLPRWLPEAIMDLRSALDQWRPEAIVAVGLEFKVPPDVCDRHRPLNLHCAPLPEYRGSWCASAAILDGAAEFGATLHRMAPEIDAGPIVLRDVFPIAPTDTARGIRERAQEIGLCQVIRYAMGERPEERAQVGTGRFCTKLDVLAQGEAAPPEIRARALECFWRPV